VDYLSIAVGSTGQIRFGNAPVQSCDWSAVLHETGAADVADFYGQRGVDIAAEDLRAYVTERDAMGAVRELQRRGETDVVAIDLGTTSFLDAVYRADAPFRVHDYDPERIERLHSAGHHVYLIHRHVLEADAIVSIPKLKVHEKVGVTCSIKGCVGAMAHKDSLAHHRFGPASRGGDEYPSDPVGIFRLASRVHDYVNRPSTSSSTKAATRAADAAFRRILKRLNPAFGGAWWGNDTAWRMGVDVARIVTHADSTGTVHEAPQRSHWVIIDGVIGGEGRGPLKPDPVRSGLVAFADDPLVADYAAATLMGFDPAKVPYVNACLSDSRLGLHRDGFESTTVRRNGRSATLAELPQFAHRFRPPPGWQGHIER
jgi:hypothetical protein